MYIVNPNNVPVDRQVYIHATDTCYGLAARWDDPASIEQIRDLKKRPDHMPFSLLFADLPMLRSFCQLSSEQEQFIAQQTEPSSFILDKLDVLADYFPDFPDISARIENDRFPVRLSSLLKSPVTTTTVNINGEPPLYDPAEIIYQFGDADITLINSETLDPVSPSTIWRLNKGEPTKIR